MPAEPLHKTRYEFTGWNTSSDGSGIHYEGGDTFIMQSGNVTLYAEWGLSSIYESHIQTLTDYEIKSCSIDSLDSTKAIIAFEKNSENYVGVFVVSTDGTTIISGTTQCITSENIEDLQIYKIDTNKALLLRYDSTSGTIANVLTVSNLDITVGDDQILDPSYKFHTYMGDVISPSQMIITRDQFSSIDINVMLLNIDGNNVTSGNSEYLDLSHYIHGIVALSSGVAIAVYGD